MLMICGKVWYVQPDRYAGVKYKWVLREAVRPVLCARFCRMSEARYKLGEPSSPSRVSALQNHEARLIDSRGFAQLYVCARERGRPKMIRQNKAK